MSATKTCARRREGEDETALISSCFRAFVQDGDTISWRHNILDLYYESNVPGAIKSLVRKSMWPDGAAQKIFKKMGGIIVTEYG